MVRLWAHAGLVDLAHWLAFAWVLTFVFRSWASWRFLLNFNLSASVAVGLIAIAQRLDFLLLGYVGPFERLESTLGNPSYTGAYLVMNVFVAMGFLGWSLLREGDRPTPSRHAWLWPEGLWRMFWASAALLDVTVLYLGGSRGALVGLLAGLLFFGAGYVAWGREGRLRSVSMAALGLAAVVVLVVALVRNTAAFGEVARHDLMLSRIAATGAGDASLTGRIDVAQAGLKGFTERPILGWGRRTSP